MQKLKNIYHLIQSLIANVRYGFPARKLTIIGVTGTDGKTTTTTMLYHTLKESGVKVGMISTINAKIGDEEIDTGLHVTTPEPWDLPRLLRRMIREGITHVVIESTSSGLDQNRLFGVRYDAVTITNIGHDHIDYHGSWKKYAQAKYKIIEKTKDGGLVVLNYDHEESRDWLERKIENVQNKNIIWYSVDELLDTNHSVDGITFTFDDETYSIPLIGEYNFSNALGVIIIARRYVAINKIINALKTFSAPLGRMQVMQTEPNAVIIDFAHTPSSLERALESIQKIRPTEQSAIWCIFGCAGQRDPDRRRMGLVSAKMADKTLITLEDPRTEDIVAINTEIAEHGEKGGGQVITRFVSHEDFEKRNNEFNNLENKAIISFDYPTIENRIDAISFACKMAKPDDIVYITGKGHEESLAIGDPIVEYPYTDQDTVEAIITQDV
ncbi:UDP-N-acetylmuramyl-tripeptide synthetase [Candidatus Dojkabacteria bacterium]|uniref:UDP-N-acetylmuramyl-tripeptide synthetase n=1 Tax=Candidatus Dojkabacteria bacterium TaxID=2099670 RepID=A0A955RK08_9BACT|nr:UDP-N-acetylmuramyl-tripeptide synthetase [Candidatus Dojkabacteria bacterium]